MRPVLSLSLVAAALAGCAHQAPTLVTSTVAAAPKAAAAAPVAPAAAKPVQREVVSSASLEAAELSAEAREAADAAKNPTLENQPALLDEADVAEGPVADADALAAMTPRLSVATTSTGEGDASAQSFLDPWRPYAIGVLAKSAKTVTLAWRTDARTRAAVYFGKSFNLTNRGWDGVTYDDNKSTYHQITIGPLSRFRSYTFTVVGIGELGMRYDGYPIKTRTNLFF